MAITLTAELEEIVTERVRSGAYASPHDVLMTSLRLLIAQEDRLAELRRELQIGLDAIEQGRFITCTTDADFDNLASEIISQAQERRNQVSP